MFLNPTWLSCLQCREPTSSAVFIPNRFDMDSKFWEVLTGMILCIKRSFGGLKALELTHSPSCVPATSLPGWSSISAGLWSCRNFGYNWMQQVKWSGCAVIPSCLCLGLEYFGFWFPALDLRADNWAASKPGVTSWKNFSNKVVFWLNLDICWCWKEETELNFYFGWMSRHRHLSQGKDGMESNWLVWSLGCLVWALFLKSIKCLNILGANPDAKFLIFLRQVSCKLCAAPSHAKSCC